jgi:hypothetical protein
LQKLEEEGYNKNMTGLKTGEVVNPIPQPKVPGLEPVTAVKLGSALAEELEVVKTTTGASVPRKWMLPGETPDQAWMRTRMKALEEDAEDREIGGGSGK